MTGAKSVFPQAAELTFPALAAAFSFFLQTSNP